MPAATAPEVSEVLELLRGIGALLHASGEERALSSLRVSLGEAGGGAPAVASALHGARVKSDEAWAAAKVSAGDSWGARFDGAREALETERYRVDKHASAPEDYYAVVSGYSAVHERVWHSAGRGGCDVPFLRRASRSGARREGPTTRRGGLGTRRGETSRRPSLESTAEPTRVAP